MAETTTFLLIVDSDGNGIRYNRKGEVIQEKTWYGPGFSSGQYKETTTGDINNLTGIQTEIERTGNLPPNFAAIVKNTAEILEAQQSSSATTVVSSTTDPEPETEPEPEPEPEPEISLEVPKASTTKTTYVPVSDSVYNLPNGSSITVISPLTAIIEDANGQITTSSLTSRDYQQLQEYADKGYGPALQQSIVETATGNVVQNTGETTPTIPESVPSVESTAADFGSADKSYYVDRTRTQLLNDITLSDGLLAASVNVLNNTTIPNTNPPVSLAEQIKETGITEELRSQFPEQIGEYLGRLSQKEAILDAIKERQKQCASATDNNASWSAERECPDGFNFSQLRALEAEYEKEIRDLPDPCGKSTLAGINNALTKFFNFLKGAKKYYNLYVAGTINAVKNISSIIANTSEIIASVLKLLVQRMRNFIINLLRKLIEKVINKILTSLTKALKNTVIKAIVDALICAFDKIIKGLAQLVTDFLFSMIGNVINTGFCAVEQFTNALLNNLAASIDKALKPILDGINDVLGGIAKIAGSVFQAMDYILGFESFLCSKPDCPQIKSFKADAWAGPTPAMIEGWSWIKDIPDAAGAENWVLDQVDEFLDKNNVLTGATIFGDKYSDLDKNISARDQSLLGPCNTGAWRCGPPQVTFFGGGGAGAVGDAVVNSIGEVVGVNLRYGGKGYTSPPFVTFTDNCGNGNFASAYTITNSSGEVTRVIMVNSGGGYLSAPSGLDEFGSIDEEQLLGQQIVNQTREYVGCIDAIQIISTGIGYSPNDSITIEPDIPGLQVNVRMTEVGQIVSMDIQTPGCGLVEIPTITINSTTGAGLDVRPVLTFYNKTEYLQNPENRPEFNPNKIVQVTNCVLK